jgi:spore coat protein U-like protein
LDSRKRFCLPGTGTPPTPRLAGLLMLLIAATGGNAWAAVATATGTLSVTASVTSSCIVGASTLAFSAQTSAAILAGNIDATGTIEVNCTSGSPYTIALSAGNGAGATMASRKMTSTTGAQLLSYTVYTTAARTTVWGDGAGGGASSATVPGTGSGAAQPVTVFGRIFSGQQVIASAYADVINVTVSY